MSICYRGASGFWSWLPLTWMTARRSVIKWRMGDSIYLWIQEAGETRKLVERYPGYNASTLQRMKLSKRPAVEGIDLVEDSDSEPPKGERQRRLINEGSLAQAREERLQCTWAELELWRRARPGSAFPSMKDSEPRQSTEWLVMCYLRIEIYRFSSALLSRVSGSGRSPGRGGRKKGESERVRGENHVAVVLR